MFVHSATAKRRGRAPHRCCMWGRSPAMGYRAHGNSRYWCSAGCVLRDHGYGSIWYNTSTRRRNCVYRSNGSTWQPSGGTWLGYGSHSGNWRGTSSSCCNPAEQCAARPQISARVALAGFRHMQSQGVRTVAEMAQHFPRERHLRIFIEETLPLAGSCSAQMGSSGCACRRWLD